MTTTPTPDPLDAILQEMLVQYTAWVNGEPVKWNVKKREAKAALTAHIKTVCEEVIGQNEMPEGTHMIGVPAVIRDKLRAEQRTRLQSLTKEEEKE